jgi:orotate phosphoribosyltransferase
MHAELLGLIAGRRGHFRMESGLHSEWWFELGRLFAQPERVRPHAVALARRLAAHRIDAVCGPMTGGAKLAEMIATELGISHLCAERLEPRAGGS